MRLGVVLFPHLARRVAARHVEVAEDRVAEARVGRRVVTHQVLDEELRAAVGVDRSLRRGFPDGQAIRRDLPVGRARRAEHQLLDPRLRHRRQQAEAPFGVVAVVAKRLADRLTHVRQRGEVHHRTYLVIPK